MFTAPCRERPSWYLRFVGSGSMNTETAARPSEYTRCATGDCAPVLKRFISITFLNPTGWLFTVQPVSPSWDESEPVGSRGQSFEETLGRTASLVMLDPMVS